MRPHYVDWAITTRCNLKCEHCIAIFQRELPFERACELAEEIVALDPEWLILEGGEPLMRERLQELLHRMNPLDVYLITNGMMFNERWIKTLKGTDVKLIFSMDGSTKPVYEETKKNASFDKFVHAIELASREGLFHGITVVLSKKNLHQIDEFIEFVRQRRGEFITFIPLKPFGNGGSQKKYYETYALSDEGHARALLNMYKNTRSNSVKIYYDEPFLWAFAEREGFKIPGGRSGITIPDVKGCAWGSSLYIRPDGRILPCMFSPDELALSKYPEENLDEAWEKVSSSNLMRAFKSRENRLGPCAMCKYFDSCHGCPSRIYRLYGDFSGSDPACPLQ